jgi:ParB family chromosome partitioning protein
MTETSSTVEQIDPASLLVGINIRTHAALDKDFLASIRELGVLVPIVAVRTPEGELRVRFGHRRTLAAVEVGRPTVPVVILSDDETAAASESGEATRIVAQWHENEQRAGLSTSDKVAAVEQLSLLGLSAAQIVKHTKAGKQDVAAAMAASGSDLAKGAAGRYEFLTLDAAAAIAEFEADTATVKALVAAAKRSDGEFRHVLQRARDDRDEATHLAALTEQLTASGVPIIDRPDYTDRSIKAVTDLLTGDGKRIDSHADCPANAAYLRRSYDGVEAVYVCTDWKTNGHRDRYNTSSTSGSVGGPMDEKAKAERREVVTRNKEWKSATVVRRDWLTIVLARKTSPKGTAAYVAGELARGSHQLRRAMERSPDLAATLLGADATHSRQAVSALTDTATDARAQVIGLAVVLGAVENATDVQTWRNPDETVKRYFAFLAANGYVCSEVEQIAAGTYTKPKQRRHRISRDDKPTAATETTADTASAPDEPQSIQASDIPPDDAGDPADPAEPDAPAAA